ncbi:MAG: metal ABC transporter solute-binding protein, Zn/Mn family [Thermodesulfovibrio sp.]
MIKERREMRKIGFILLFFSVISFCEGKINIGTTILPYGGIIEDIGKEKVNVIVLVPPGAEPHTYEPKPFQLKEISRSIAYFKVGTRIEFENLYLAKIAKLNRNMRIYDTSQGIDLIENDPHIWNSLKNIKTISQNILDGLCEVDKKNAEFYKKNYEVYIKKIENLHNEISQALKDKKGKQFIVFHPAFAYFAHDYGLIQIPIQMGESEPGPKDMKNLIKIAKEKKINLVITEPQFSPKTAKVIAKAINGKVVSIDPLSKDVYETVKKLKEALVE